MRTASAPVIIFDTDPGADDALALIWLCALHRSGRILLERVTTVGGNVGVGDTSLNADLLLALCGGADIPLHVGGDAGGEQARHVHGSDGLAGLRSTLNFEPRAPDTSNALMALRGVSADSTLIAVGPLTNLAQSTLNDPRALSRADRVVVMGGALDGGNITPHAEFNVHYDPESWACALEHAQLDVITLEITHQVYFDEAIASTPLPGKLGEFTRELLDAMCRTGAERLGRPRFFVHDAVAVAAVCYPELLEFREIGLRVELEGARRGALTEDPGLAHNARVAASVDAEALKNVLIADISHLCQELVLTR